MIYIAIARYTRDVDLLAAARPAHHVYAQELRLAGRLLMAGPFADDTGALLVYRARSLEEAQDLVARDPFQQSGVFVGTELRLWNVLAADVAALGRLFP